MTAQACVLAATPAAAQFLQFSLSTQLNEKDFKDLFKRVPISSDQFGYGLSANLCQQLSIDIPEHKSVPTVFQERLAALNNDGRIHRVTEHTQAYRQADLWIWLRNSEGNRGELVRQSQQLAEHLASHFKLEDSREAFNFHKNNSQDNCDLTGYIDGTENPTGTEAEQAALSGDGSSFLAAQIWSHDLNHFNHKPQQDRDHIIGRRLSDNVELDEAPAHAHTKRTAQEQFDPEAFVVRRSMPWSNGAEQGLYFLAFGHSFDAFEAQWRNMLGLNDDILDGLFQFSEVIDSQYYWLPNSDFLTR